MMYFLWHVLHVECSLFGSIAVRCCLGDLHYACWAGRAGVVGAGACAGVNREKIRVVGAGVNREKIRVHVCGLSLCFCGGSRLRHNQHTELIL